VDWLGHLSGLGLGLLCGVHPLHEAWSGVCPVRIDVYHLNTSDDQYRGVKERKKDGE
jgi:hypothetical protein